MQGHLLLGICLFSRHQNSHFLKVISQWQLSGYCKFNKFAKVNPAAYCCLDKIYENKPQLFWPPVVTINNNEYCGGIL